MSSTQPTSATSPTQLLGGAITPIDWPRFLVEIGVVLGVGLLLNSMGVLDWTQYTILFVLAIMALNPSETMAFFNGLSQFITGAVGTTP